MATTKAADGQNQRFFPTRQPEAANARLPSARWGRQPHGQPFGFAQVRQVAYPTCYQQNSKSEYLNPKQILNSNYQNPRYWAPLLARFFQVPLISDWEKFVEILKKMQLFFVFVCLMY